MPAEAETGMLNDYHHYHVLCPCYYQESVHGTSISEPLVLCNKLPPFLFAKRLACIPNSMQGGGLKRNKASVMKGFHYNGVVQSLCKRG